MARTTFLKRYLSGLAALLFPECCHACNRPLCAGEVVICTHCAYELPRTDFHLQAVNPVSRLFWGRVDIAAASAYYTFQKGSRVQQLIHRLKYKGHTEIGLLVGKMYGRELLKAEAFRKITQIIPVPLHARKLKMRGFNQSECFAEGISEALGVPVNQHILVRGKETGTQTRKSRFSRWRNVESGFYLTSPDELKGQRVLLVDDVVTTGATLEACAKTLLEVEGTTVCIAAMAVAVL